MELEFWRGYCLKILKGKFVRVVQFRFTMNIKILKFYFGQFRGMSGSIFLSLLGSLLQFVPYYFIFTFVRRAFDFYIPDKNFPALSGIVALIILLFLVKSAIMFTVKYLTLQINKNFVAKLRMNIVTKLQGLPYLNVVELDFTKHHILMVQHTEKVYQLNSSLINQALPALMASLIFLGYLAYTNLKMTLVLSLVLIPLFFITKSFLFKLSNQFKEVTQKFRSFNKRTIFMLRALDLIKTLSSEAFEIEKQKNRIESLNQAETRLSFLKIMVTLIQDLIFSLLGIVILLAGGYSVIQGTMSLGMMLAYYSAVLVFKNYLQAFFSTLPQMEEGKASLNELYEFFMIEAPQVYTGTNKIESLQTITLKDVSFTYLNEPLLKSVNLELSQSKMTVISGLNGSGKTTLLNLIVGLMAPTQGELLANQCNYQELDITHFRTQLGILRQTPFIFKGTILDNITYGRERVPLFAVEEAAKLAGIFALIDELPKKFETVVGENGTTLSGGECQKIALARALLNRPKFIFLDEPSNHLDVNSIVNLMEQLKKGEYQPTCLIISHENRVIEQADIHYNLVNGELEILQ